MRIVCLNVELKVSYPDEANGTFYTGCTKNAIVTAFEIANVWIFGVRVGAWRELMIYPTTKLLQKLDIWIITC